MGKIMSTLDIRNKDEISDIQFDNTKDRIKFKDGYLILINLENNCGFTKTFIITNYRR